MNLLSQHRKFYHNVRSIYKVYKHMPYKCIYISMYDIYLYVPLHLHYICVAFWFTSWKPVSWLVFIVVSCPAYWLNEPFRSGLCRPAIPGGIYACGPYCCHYSWYHSFQSLYSLLLIFFLVRDLIETLFCGSSRCVHWRYLHNVRNVWMRSLFLLWFMTEFPQNKPVCR